MTLLDVTFFQIVRFLAQNHNCRCLKADVVLTAATAGKLIFCLLPDVPEEKKQVLD